MSNLTKKQLLKKLVEEKDFIKRLVEINRNLANEMLKRDRKIAQLKKMVVAQQIETREHKVIINYYKSEIYQIVERALEMSLSGADKKQEID